MVDHVNGHYIRTRSGFPSYFTNHTLGVSFFDQVRGHARIRTQIPTRKARSCIITDTFLCLEAPPPPDLSCATVAQMAVFEVGDHPAAARDTLGNFTLPYFGDAETYDKAALARMKKTVEPFV